MIERLDLQGNVGLEVRAVGDMQVRAHQRIPRVDEAQHGPHFRRVRLHVVAIEVDILRRRPPAGLNRATLIGAIPAPDALVTVRVECGDEEHRNPLQQPIRRGISKQFAQRSEPGIFAVAFTRVDAALDHEQRNRLGAQIPRRERAGSRDQQATHDASFRRAAVLERAHRFGPRTCKFGAQALDLLETSSFFVIGQFRDRHQCLVIHRWILASAKLRYEDGPVGLIP